MADDPFVTVTYGEVRLVAAPEKPPPKKIGWWGKVAGFFSTSFTVLTKMAIIVSVLGVLAVTWSEVFNRPVVLEPIGMPTKLAEMGFSKEVAAQRLWDAVVEINDQVDTVKGHTSFVSQARQLEVAEPGMGLSIQSLADLMRSLFNKPQTRVAGEFICTDLACTLEKVELRVRVFDGKNLRIARLGPVGTIKTDEELNEYFHAAGIEVLRLVDPYVLSVFFSNQGNVDSAKKIAKAMIESKGDDLMKWGYVRRGNIQIRQKSFEEAKNSFEMAIEIDPSLAVSHSNLGNALGRLGFSKEALQSFEAAIQLDPEEVYSHNGKGSVLYNLNRNEEALQSLEKALSLDPAYVNAHNGMGLVLRKLGRKKDAIVSYQRAIELDPDYRWAYNNMGFVLFELGKFSEAIASHQKAIALGYDGRDATRGWRDALISMVDNAPEKCVTFAELFSPFKTHLLAADKSWALVDFEEILAECPIEEG